MRKLVGVTVAVASVVLVSAGAAASEVVAQPQLHDYLCDEGDALGVGRNTFRICTRVTDEEISVRASVKPGKLPDPYDEYIKAGKWILIFKITQSDEEKKKGWHSEEEVISVKGDSVYVTRDLVPVGCYYVEYVSPIDHHGWNGLYGTTMIVGKGTLCPAGYGFEHPGKVMKLADEEL